jgi:putative transposase
MTAQLVADALLTAVWRRGKPDALLHHSDQGSQYTSLACFYSMAPVDAGFGVVNMRLNWR